MPPNADAPRGLFASAIRLGVAILALAENKCAQFANEWEAERIWQLRIALRMVLAGMALMLAGLFAAVWMVWMLWDLNQAIAILTPCAVFSSIGALLWRSSNVLRAAKPPAFEMTRDELRKDRSVLHAFTGEKHD